jgi:ketosteroid isomerase-like protein
VSSNRDLIDRQYEAFNAGTVLAEGVHPEITWMAAREDPDAATHRGVEAIGDYFAQWFGAFEEPKLQVVETIDGDDRVFAWIAFSGRGISSGAPVEMQQAQVFSFRDGKVVRVEEYFDRAEGIEATRLTE